MTDINLKCPVPQCEYETGSNAQIVAVALLNAHTTVHSTAIPVARHGPKIDRPCIDIGTSAEEWQLFERRWSMYKKSSAIRDTDASTQLFQCATNQLGDAILRIEDNISSKSEKDLLRVMKSLAIIPVAIMVTRAELLAMRQNRDENFRSFYSKVRGKAEVCAYSTQHTCECGKANTVDLTEILVRDVIIAGIYDEDIRRRVMSTNDLCQKSANDIVSMVESEEMARDSIRHTPVTTATDTNVHAASSSVSSNQRSKTVTPQSQLTNKQIPCPHCKKDFYEYKKGRFGWNKKPHTMCSDCHRARNKRQHNSENESGSVTASLAQIASITFDTDQDKSARRQKAVKLPCHIAPISLSHHIFTKGEWKKARFMEHPTISLNMSADNSHYKTFGVKSPHVPDKTVTCIADTGAQSNLWSLNECFDMGFSEADLIPVKSALSAANKSRIHINGAVLLKMSGMSNSGYSIECSAMVYVSSDVSGFYLSHESMIDLGIISYNFPSVGDVFSRADQNGNTHDAMLAGTKVDKCDCPTRSPVPLRPSELPFTCTPDNIGKMKTWLLDTFASSSFNTCPHQDLPCMTGPPIEMHLDPKATPRVCHTPANVPLHWQEKVRSDLERDVALGVIERVPYGEPVTWCHRMVVTRKHDGTPRRTVDLSPLNKFCKRETFAMESPFQLARKVPRETWKTVSDAWNGYHSVPLQENDRHLTTFITPFGRFRYKRAPQGFVSSGDGYNRRFDAILSDFLRKERCVDDTIHYDGDLEEHWWRTIDLLRTVGEAGIVLNPEKFQFCGKSVEFAGFRLSDSTIEPLPKYLDAIRDFPTPKNITDIRSWFGLVNQVANYAQLRDIMAPFRPFRSPKNLFQWTDELDNAFNMSKEAIVAAIIRGVEIFDVKKKTCLRPDWSRQGIGYFLLQKHCGCPSDLPDCCRDGWRIVLAGSRFLQSAEQRYAAIEGEALAVAWGLEHSKYFTQGCEDLIVVTDHKPLVKILGDRTLDEITNTRLFRLKQRTLPWHFTIFHLPGKTNYAADATSRNPSPRINDYSDHVTHSLLSWYDEAEVLLTAAISDDITSTFSLSWSDLCKATAADATLDRLCYLVENGFPQKRSDLSEELTLFWNFREALFVHEGVIMYDDRVVVPAALRRTVLTVLHAAHQGVSMMEARARSIVFWPGISQDIKNVRDACLQCCRNAPSQAATPSVSPQIPSTPFECIVADFFESHGHQFLVVADRLSGWVEIFGSPSGSFKSTADGLIAHLRNLFMVFGVPEELSSDGGPQFRASITESFLARWGIRHRVSSAYFPQSNGRAEVAVKTAKRLLLDNIGPSGSLNNDKFLRAILQLRNTPDPDCHVSPAEIVFGRQLRDAFTFINRIEKFKNPDVRPMWREAWQSKESALRTRFTRNMERLNAHTRNLPSLIPGERVFVQNQVGSHPTKWDKSGIIIESQGNDQYLVKIDGSGRLTLRNRRFLRRYTNASPSISYPKPAILPLTDQIPHVQCQPQQVTPELEPLAPHEGNPNVGTRDIVHMNPPENESSDSTQSSDPLPHIPATTLPTQPLEPAHVPQTELHVGNTQRPRRDRKPRKFYQADTGTYV